MNTWYRVVGFGLSGAPKKTPEEAWASDEAAGRRAYGYAESDQGTSRAAHSARLITATTRRAALDADVSVTRGLVATGKWWFVRDADQ